MGHGLVIMGLRQGWSGSENVLDKCSCSLQDYLTSRGLGVRDVLARCCDKLESGDYHCTGQHNHTYGSTWYPDGMQALYGSMQA